MGGGNTGETGVCLCEGGRKNFGESYNNVLPLSNPQHLIINDSSLLLMHRSL